MAISPIQWFVAGGFFALLIVALILKYFEAKKHRAKRTGAKRKV